MYVVIFFTEKGLFSVYFEAMGDVKWASPTILQSSYKSSIIKTMGDIRWAQWGWNEFF